MTGSAATVRLAVGALVCFVPVVAVALSPWRPDAGLVYLGVLPTLIAMGEGRKVAAVTAVATPAAVLVGLSLSSNPIIGTGLMVLLSLGVAWSYRHGCPGAATYIASAGALAVMSAPTSRWAETFAGDLPPDLVVAGLVLLGGAWVAVVGSFVLRDFPSHPGPPPSVESVRVFAVVLAVTVGVGTALVMAAVPGRYGWWVVLTVLAVVLPDMRGTTTRVIHRVAGTALGGLAAGLFLAVVDSPSVTRAVGLVLALACALAFIFAPYWVFVTFLTPALALATFPLDTALATEAQRVLFTLVGALAVVLVGGLTRLVMIRWRSGRPGGTPTPSPAV